ncbi:D-alanine--D-alanine ligase [Rhodospirillum rubrum]|uniref:D-alanine--D-alanine ligase n=1 Tax=Rhodospirillum rubrum (strain ATCC 11170 / ATH 1.1.1 / DSM 467 / LMG 4362 / NCIMB 8255 / S1) TaxID=269796 RepID=DDL_RHORT|nr:D-alanine--D-alanine ligase [Rhodospirillum rubrum]Q2RVU7.1 RecName: Full=D-alanine--D-alanine ligase; AltName: Full=D-Ala-D-Ala ligase; AltName: Full=D-alanylalanine synthetase [Rhodospirillum rubrum ATCC 11170]ABC21748.1 D-alanine--D-alanine ligase [Rhodospirillum rubrum ATCC 11170]AEO47446.1 D-alanine--D-alanine ligase [Rhodospirillum rubrum F11]MBK5953305.1 D-alanine--D-alanine ligase [Rhodospirillum rubrum]QXG81410.1 D-alanine--D-alanine ligase [Rhodospirillum rubrum]HAQ01199.1 D-alan
MSKRVTVLMGGFSTERAVSLNSGAAAGEALRQAGYAVTLLDVGRDVAAFIAALTQTRPDVVFNALHGRFGEDGAIQGILDIMALPYTHSGRLASAIAMDKPSAKLVFERFAIPVAPHVVADRASVLAETAMARPYVVKPLDQGSSVGVTIVTSETNDLPFSRDDWPYGRQVMVERFIPGRELTVGVMGDKALGVTEIVTDHRFYDYDAKYAQGGSRHIVPAPVAPEVFAQAQELSVLAHQALGCRGVSRADLRFDGETLYMLEVNTQPGMTDTSLVPEQALHAGISFPDLVTWLVETAQCDA